MKSIPPKLRKNNKKEYVGGRGRGGRRLERERERVVFPSWAYSLLSFPMFPRCSCLPEPRRSCFTSAFVFPGTVYQGKSCQGPLLRREKVNIAVHLLLSFPPFSLFFHRSHFLLQRSSKPIVPSVAFPIFRFFFVTSKTKIIKLTKIYSNLCLRLLRLI